MILTHISPLLLPSRTSNDCVKNICFTCILVQAELRERVGTVGLPVCQMLLAEKSLSLMTPENLSDLIARNLTSQLTIIRKKVDF